MKKSKLAQFVVVMFLLQPVQLTLADTCSGLGTINYTSPQGQSYVICVDSLGGFDLLGQHGSLDPTNGNISYGGETRFYKDIPGITSYTPKGQAAVLVTSASSDLPVTSGTVWYINPVTKIPSEITIKNGAFVLDGKNGTINRTASGLYMVYYAGQVSELRNISGVSMYQLEGKGVVSVKTGTTGTVYGENGVRVAVVNGKFTWKGYKGELEQSGDYVMENGAKGNILTTEGVIGYQLAGGIYMPVTVGLTGTITYRGKVYKVTNGNFTLDNGITGSFVSANEGTYKLSNEATIYRLATTEGIEGYQISGKPYVSLITNGTQSLTAWLSANKGKTFINDPWSHNGGVNDAMMRAWLTANPNLSATQILDDMATYKIDIRQFIAAKYYTDSTTGFTSTDDSAKIVAGTAMNFIGPGATQWSAAMKFFNDAGITNHDLVNRGVLQTGGPGSTMGQGLSSACFYGIVRLGVCFAYQFGLHPGQSRTDEQIFYSQKDLDEASGYEKNGYWPDGTGEIASVLVKKYGSLAGADKACPHACYDKSESGPNIADLKMYGLLPSDRLPETVPTVSEITKTITGSTNVGTITTVDGDDDTTIVDKACTNITYYMSISYTKSPTSAMRRAQSTDNNTDGQVTDLQSFLKDQGFMDQSVTTTGRYGSMTTKAVKALQAKHNLSQTGATGPLTRAKIKALSCQ